MGRRIESLPKSLQDAIRRQEAKNPSVSRIVVVPTKRRKFGNIPTETEDGKFDSKLEAAVWETLAKKYGKRRLARQVGYVLPGGVRMVVDFQLTVIIDGKGIIVLLDAKGMEPTQDWKNKRKQVMEIYGIKNFQMIRSVKEARGLEWT